MPALQQKQIQTRLSLGGKTYARSQAAFSGVIAAGNFRRPSLVNGSLHSAEKEVLKKPLELPSSPHQILKIYTSVTAALKDRIDSEIAYLRQYHPALMSRSFMLSASGGLLMGGLLGLFAINFVQTHHSIAVMNKLESQPAITASIPAAQPVATVTQPATQATQTLPPAENVVVCPSPDPAICHAALVVAQNAMMPIRHTSHHHAIGNKTYAEE